jgi:hypothetical protein
MEPFELPTDAEIEAVRQRSEAASRDEVYAESVQVDVAKRELRLDLPDGVAICLPIDRISELAAANKADLQDLSLSLSGLAITSRRLNVDISVEGLILDLLGGKAWKQAMRRHLNREQATATSARKALAARANGKKGGRPKKKAV